MELTFIVAFYISVLGIVIMLVLKNRELSLGKQSFVARLGSRTDSTVHDVWGKFRYYMAHVNATNAIGSVQWVAFHFLSFLKKMYIKIHEMAYGNPHSKKVIDMVKGRGVEHTRGAASFFLKKISEDKIVGRVREEIRDAQSKVHKAQAKVQATVMAATQATQDFFPRVTTQPAMATNSASVNSRPTASSGSGSGDRSGNVAVAHKTHKVSTISTVFPDQVKIKSKKPKHVSFRRTKPIEAQAPEVTLPNSAEKVVKNPVAVEVTEPKLEKDAIKDTVIKSDSDPLLNTMSRPLVRNKEFKRKTAKPIIRKHAQENITTFD